MKPTFVHRLLRSVASTSPYLATLLLGFALTLAGCGGGSGSGADTKEVEAAFASADPALKGPADEAVKAIKAGQYLEGANALLAVAKASADKELSEPQENAIVNLGAAIQMVLAAQGDKADLKVYQAIEDMMAALSGREASKVGTNPDAARPPAAPKE